MKHFLSIICLFLFLSIILGSIAQAENTVSASEIAAYLTKRVLNTSSIYSERAKIAMVILDSESMEYTLLGRTEAMDAPPMSFSADFLQFLQKRPEFKIVYPRYFTRPQIDQGRGITFFNIIITLTEKGITKISRSISSNGKDETISIKVSGKALKNSPEASKLVRFSLYSAWGEQPVDDLKPSMAKELSITFYKSPEIGKAAFRFTRSNEVISFMSLK